MRVVLHGFLAISFQSPVLVDRSGFMAGLTSVPFSRGVHDCSTMWISGSILTWYARHKVLWCVFDELVDL